MSSLLLHACVFSQPTLGTFFCVTTADIRQSLFCLISLFLERCLHQEQVENKLLLLLRTSRQKELQKPQVQSVQGLLLNYAIAQLTYELTLIPGLLGNEPKRLQANAEKAADGVKRKSLFTCPTLSPSSRLRPVQGEIRSKFKSSATANSCFHV